MSDLKRIHVNSWHSLFAVESRLVVQDLTSLNFPLLSPLLLLCLSNPITGAPQGGETAGVACQETTSKTARWSWGFPTSSDPPAAIMAPLTHEEARWRFIAGEKWGKWSHSARRCGRFFFPLVTHPHSSCQVPEDLKKSYVVSYLISQDSSNNWLHFCRSKIEAAAAACLQTLLLGSDMACAAGNEAVTCVAQCVAELGIVKKPKI